MTYRGVGSSTGQAEFLGNVTFPDNDFASGDIPISEEDYAQFPSGSIIHLPIVFGAISFFHSVPTGETKLNLTPCVLAKIFKRDITSWTDSEIIELNPDLSLSGESPITVGRRVEGSSSTASITAYLNTACPEEWPETLVGSTIEWDAGTKECEGSGGMTNCLRDVAGTIGYIGTFERNNSPTLRGVIVLILPKLFHFALTICRQWSWICGRFTGDRASKC